MKWLKDNPWAEQNYDTSTKKKTNTDLSSETDAAVISGEAHTREPEGEAQARSSDSNSVARAHSPLPNIESRRTDTDTLTEQRNHLSEAVTAVGDSLGDNTLPGNHQA
jgi:hypothetical protein